MAAFGGQALLAKVMLNNAYLASRARLKMIPGGGRIANQATVDCVVPTSRPNLRERLDCNGSQSTSTAIPYSAFLC
jgi:hypothetical protein